MRKLNSKLRTNFISECGTRLQNKDYFAFVELDEYACYVVADGIDDDLELEGAKVVVTSIIRNFTEKPSMTRLTFKKLLQKANEELIMLSDNARLKASVTIAITDYSKVRYASVGNTRFYLFRDGFLRMRSEDHSLTQMLAAEEEVAADQIAKHTERNNLYCYLGQHTLYKPFISRKIKLVDGDIIALLTRGLWENVDDQEIKDAVDEAKDPKGLLDNVEDMLLSKQLKDIENYTLAFTFVDKTFVNPKKKTWIKKMLIALIPILIVAIIAAVFWKISRDKRADNIEEMNTHKISATQYLEKGNMTKASLEYKAALDIATKYKLKSEKEDLDLYYKFTETILDADEKLKDKKYDEALEKYLEALDQTDDTDNIAKGYIEEKLYIARNSINVTDLLSAGNKSEEAGNTDEALKNYALARDLAASLYMQDEKKEAQDKIDKINEAKNADAKDAKEAADKAKADSQAAEEKQKTEAEKKAKEKADTEAKAAEYAKQGDLSYVSGDYVNAKMYYVMAKQLYEQIGKYSFSSYLEERIRLMDKKIGESESKKSQADRYARAGDEKYIAKDYASAKILYQLAKEIYQKENLTDDVKKMDEKLALVESALKKS
ncbi:MAG: PP2C family serine/threonine-protein phosphatase [Clostridiaceae bacterium]